MSNKFEDFLSEPQEFSEGEWVASDNYSKKEFYEYLLEQSDTLYDYDLDRDMTIEEFSEAVREDWVHFHINGADYEFQNKPAWWLGSK